MNQKFTRLWATKNKDDEWWSSFVTAPLAIGVNYFAVDAKWLTPNRITLLSFVLAIVSVLYIIRGGTVSFFIAAILIQLSHVLDCMDGHVHLDKAQRSYKCQRDRPALKLRPI